MKKRIIFLLAVFLLATCLFACSKPGKPDDTSVADSEVTTSGETEPENFEDKNVSIMEKTVKIKNGESEIQLSVKDNKLYIDSLTRNDINYMAEGSEFVLPKAYKDSKQVDFDWELFDVVPYADKYHFAQMSGVTFKFNDGAVEADVTCRYYVGMDGPFEFQTVIVNDKKSGNLTVYPYSFASFDFAKGSNDKLFYVAKESGTGEGYTQRNGNTLGGSGVYEKQLKSGKKYNIWVNTNQDWNGSGFIPVAYISTDFNRGMFVGLEWSSGRVNVYGNDDKNTVLVDMDETSMSGGAFATKIPAGKELVFPNVYLGAYNGDVDDGSNFLKRWYFRYKSPEILRNNANEPQSQMDMQSGLDTHGVEAIKWDYGWWDNSSRGSCGNWNAYEGSWKLRSQSYKNSMSNYGCSTMKRFGKTADALDISWTVYVLLHDTVTAPGKPTDKEGEFNSITHPDWFSNRTIDTGMGASADLGNEECVAYLQKALSEFFKNNAITTWRSDFEPISRSSNLENRHMRNGTDVQYWCTVGFEEVVSYVIENVDGFRYESCSSGGSMKDLFTAKYATIINCDDDANYLSLRMSFYDSSYAIHPSQLQIPANIECAVPTSQYFWPKVNNTNMDDKEFKEALLNMEYRSQIIGAPMFSSWEGKVRGNYLEKYTEIFRNKVRPLLRDGDLYHILPRPDGKNWDGIMYADADSANEIKGCVFIFKPSADAGDSVSIKLRGLDASKTYNLTFDEHTDMNMTATGADLMKNGITITMTTTIGSDIIWITEK